MLWAFGIYFVTSLCSHFFLSFAPLVLLRSTSPLPLARCLLHAAACRSLHAVARPLVSLLVRPLDIRSMILLVLSFAPLPSPLIRSSLFLVLSFALVASSAPLVVRSMLSLVLSFLFWFVL